MCRPLAAAVLLLALLLGPAGVTLAQGGTPPPSASPAASPAAPAGCQSIVSSPGEGIAWAGSAPGDPAVGAAPAVGTPAGLTGLEEMTAFLTRAYTCLGHGSVSDLAALVAPDVPGDRITGGSSGPLTFTLRSIDRITLQGLDGADGFRYFVEVTYRYGHALGAAGLPVVDRDGALSLVTGAVALPVAVPVDAQSILFFHYEGGSGFNGTMEDASVPVAVRVLNQTPSPVWFLITRARQDDERTANGAPGGSGGTSGREFVGAVVAGAIQLTGPIVLVDLAPGEYIVSTTPLDPAAGSNGAGESRLTLR